MHDRDDDDSALSIPEENAEGESFNEAPAHARFQCRIQARIEQNTVDRFLNRSKEPSAKILLLPLIVRGSRDHLGLSIRMESDRLHSRDFSALAKTFSASESFTPRSTSAQRRRISRFHLADRRGAAAASRLSINFSATKALSGGGSSIASDTTL
jgi:hypothetical protein